MSKDNVVDVIEDAEDNEFKLFEDFIDKELCVKLTKHEDYRFIIGESPYPNTLNVILPYPKGI